MAPDLLKIQALKKYLLMLIIHNSFMPYYLLKVMNCRKNL